MTARATMLDSAARMRREPTEAERRMWRALSRAQLDGHKFRRQAIMAGRIVDFFCPAKGLVVEIDGDTHDADQDRRRDERLRAESGFAVVRYSNHDVMENLEGVLADLLMKLTTRQDRWPGDTAPNPSSEEEGS